MTAQDGEQKGGSSASAGRTVERSVERTVEKVLVANRGEIACRVLRSLREMGIASVAVYSDADAGAPHVGQADEAVHIGPAPSLESYLCADRILAAAERVGADALHPGYGFLAENAGFATACEERGVTFIGPSPGAIREMGSKIAAKALARKAGVPVIPGVSGEDMDDEALAAAGLELGFPLLVKASAGGGGKGMRVVREESELAASLQSCRREAAGAFGDDTLLLERYFEAPRHVEIQIFGDHHGRVVHCFERECSVQRRHQKILEEAPSPALDADLRARMGAAAVAVGEAMGYVGAGTVEFILDAGGDFYFLEVNTRLQVEHPVTEAVTGLDLVALQLLVARGEALPFQQDDLRLEGHAIEARLYAERADEDFLPATGTLVLWEPPRLPGLRIDSGVAAGSEIGIHYDPMLAKVIAYGASREEARARLVRGLEGLALGGVATNRDFLVAALGHPAFVAGELDTHFVERHLPPEARGDAPAAETLRAHAVAAALHGHELRREAGGPLPASIPSGWRNNRWRPQEERYRCGEAELRVRYVAQGEGCFEVDVVDGVEASEERGESEASGLSARIAEHDARHIVLELDGVRRRYLLGRLGERLYVHSALGSCELEREPRFPPAGALDVAGGCLAPMTGVIRELRVEEGERVEQGQVLLVLEAMKMEHEMTAQTKGVVREVRVEAGQMVDPDEILVVVEPEA